MPKHVIVALLLLGCGAATGSSGPEAATPSTPADRVPRRRSVDGYVAMLEAPGRAEWQRPAELVDALGIRPGMRVADVGTGSGYFLPWLDEAVGPEGEVVAQDIDPDLVAHVRARVEREGLDRVVPRLGRPDDPGLEPGAYDVVLLVDVFHHVAEPVPFLAHLRRALAPDGRLFVVDFPPGDSVPEAVSGHEHRIAPEAVLEAARAAGLELVREHDVPRYQFMLELNRRPRFGNGPRSSSTALAASDLLEWPAGRPSSVLLARAAGSFAIIRSRIVAVYLERGPDADP